MLKRFYDPNRHQAPAPSGVFPPDLCKKWQTDSCVLPSGQRCIRFHACQWCGLPHPGNKCRNNN